MAGKFLAKGQSFFAREYPFRLAASRQATFPKGTAFGGGDKVFGSALRRPLGGAGCERSEQTEGVIPRKKAVPKRPQAFRNCNNKV